ncbi:TRAP transporter small permease subunit [Roseinatronobacter alkalisoli]|uniref:TRAP transporter small permease protein n=1 Tax=Roseinatronobacter alkalisoli TaxID=3028235 RepID=A0ABT5TD33_9RHOB|nr:TRAP transporter small permease [Roseinatronobacter sp. HJB301]MDD7973030.1 TRAP transporter small permease [Roseinatronobacter sp. HJB301]
MALTTADAGWRRGAGVLIRGIGGLSTLCGWIAASMILSSVFITCQMIFVRFVLRQSTIWQTETVIYLMVAATMLGLPYVQKLRGHVNVDLLPLWLRPLPRKFLAILVLFSGIAVLGIMAFYAFEHWHIAFQRGWRSSSVWGPPLWIPYLAMPVGFALFILQLLADLLALLMGRDTAFGLEAD